MALPASAAAQPPPNARPTGGTVVAGAASISVEPANTVVAQSSDRAVIDFNSVELGSHQTLTLQQPNTAAVTLLRVTGPNPSQIVGRIVANGSVVITNASGIRLDKGAQITTAGLILSAPGMTDKNFMAGADVFDQPPKAGVAVTNAAGTNTTPITIRQAGLVAFIGPRVANTGEIFAKLGQVLLLAADTATIDSYSRPLALSGIGQVSSDPSGAPLVAQNWTGLISAPGGTVQLQGDGAPGVATRVVSAAGRIKTPTLGSSDGEIALGGENGTVSVTGTLAANGATSGTSGGQIQVLSQNTVLLGAKATLNASGAAGGGTVALGTTLKRAAGGASVTGEPTSAAVKVVAGARVFADALKNGDGGRICVLSTTRTVMGGKLSVTGGVTGGNGGLVEVSSLGVVALTGTVDFSAPFGAQGTLLLDPRRLIFHPRSLIW